MYFGQPKLFINSKIMNNYKPVFYDINEIENNIIISSLEKFNLLGIIPMDYESHLFELNREYLLKVKYIFNNFNINGNSIYNNEEELNSTFQQCYDIYLKSISYSGKSYQYTEFVSFILDAKKDYYQKIKPSIIQSRDDCKMQFDYVELLRSFFKEAEEEFKLIDFYSTKYHMMCEYSKKWLDEVTLQTFLEVCITLDNLLINKEIFDSKMQGSIFPYEPSIEIKYFYLDYHERNLDYLTFKTKVNAIIQSLKKLMFKHSILLTN